MSPEEANEDRGRVQRRRAELRKTCKSLAGHGYQPPATEFETVAAWCRQRGIESDVYGDGEFLQEFEAQVAELLGFEAGRFFPSGTMAQPIALRIWSERARNSRVGLHPTSHLELHEQRGYAELHGLRARLIGPAHRPLLAKDLAAVHEDLSALLVELPTRENGGQLPTLEELQELVELARNRGLRLHLDGARLWEAQAAYQRPFPEICAGFDSAYVSFYKGIGALPGSMLLGPRDFIDEAVLWQRRQGGNLYSSLINAASAAMRLEPQLAKMESFRRRALQIGELLAAIPGVQVLPDPPQVNLFHLFLEAPPEALLAARDRVAEELGLWLIGGAREADGPGRSRTEVSIYGAALDLDDGELVRAFERMMALAREA